MIHILRLTLICDVIYGLNTERVVMKPIIKKIWRYFLSMNILQIPTRANQVIKRLEIAYFNIKEKFWINLWLTQFGSPSAVNSILICYKSQRRRKNVVVPFMCTTIEMCCSTKFTTLWLCLGLWYMLYWLFLETIRARYSWSNMHKITLIPCIK